MTKEIITLIGVQNFLIIIETHDKRRLYIPKKIRPNHKLCKWIGFDNASKLSQAFGGHRISIPIGKIVKDPIRDGKIKTDYLDGMPLHQVSKKYNLCQSYILQILKK